MAQVDSLSGPASSRDSSLTTSQAHHRSSFPLEKPVPSHLPRSSFSQPDLHRPSLQALDRSSVDDTSKTSAHSSERSGSVDSDTRVPRRRTSSLLSAPSISRSSTTSPADRIRGIFRSRKSNSSPDKPTNSAQDQSDGISERDPSPVQQPRNDPFPGITPLSASSSPSDTTKAPARPRRLPEVSVDTSGRPHTPPTIESYGPTIVNTPPTPTDNSTSSQLPLRKPRPISLGTGSPPSTANSGTSSSSPNRIASQRRLRSGSATAGPSKLSNSILAPLTPTPERPSTSGPSGPSGNTGSSSPSSGFFSSVLSAAQNAATTLGSSIQISPLAANSNKSAKTSQAGQSGQSDAPDDDVKVKALARETPEDNASDKKEPAINTLGSGDLSLSQLGLSDPCSEPRIPDSAPRYNTSQNMEGRARSESTPVAPSPSLSHAPYSSNLAHDFSSSRPHSLNDHSSGAEGAERTPPATSVYEDKAAQSGVHRSGSVRSALGRRRNRGSSAATGYSTNTDRTGTTIGAAIVAANASFAQPRLNQAAPKLTGFAIASKKRNRDFHVLFKSVPDDDYLIEDYSCALQREILAHGRLYVSEGHLCFSSNILGWTTTLVISFDEIVSVEKRSTALLFKNGLMISTLHNKHVFASFTNRDATYDLIIKIWQLGHPKLQSTLNGIALEGPGGDKTERIEDDAAMEDDVDDHSLSGSEDDDSGDDIYDEDDESADLQDASHITDTSFVDGGDVDKAARKVSAAGPNGSSPELASKEGSAYGSMSADFPGPASHPPTECGDAATHYEKITGDEVIPAPLGKVYSLLFGAQSPHWIGKFLTENQKCTELVMEDKRGLNGDVTSRTYSYVKPLPGSIGPRQTRCNITESIDNLDFEKAVNVTVSTQTPDVPSGNVFSVKTRYCLSWAEKDQTRLQVNCGMEWTGKSWIKGPIENGARDGQTTYTRDLFAALKSSLETRPAAGAVQRKKKGRRTKTQRLTSSTGTETPTTAPKRDWGALEPVRGVLEPLLDIVRPILTGNVVYGLLVGLLVAAWFGFGFNGQNTGTRIYDSRVLGPYGHPERLAAYEEMWRREESELWEWLQDRAGLQNLGGEGGPRKREAEPRSVEEKLREQRVEDREVEEAIRVTEEKLRVLKDMVEKRKDGG